MKKEKTLLQIFLIPLLAIGIIAGTLPLLLLVLSGIRPGMEQNIIRMDQHTVENRKVVLENEMIEHWCRIYKESDGLSAELSEILDSHGIDINGFLGNHAAQQEYLEQIFPDMVETLQYNTASGLFLILANDESIAESAEYQGFFLRDSDPQTRIVTNSDLMLERGSKKLSQSCSIPLDSAWSTNFHFDGEGVRSADDFFYTPYVTAVENPDIAMENLGYWSRPFILEDHYMDKRQIIAYSVPLRYGDTVYGVLGVEIGVDELTGYFPVKDLDNDLNAGYALAIRQNDGSLEGVAGKGVLYDAVTRQGKDFSLLQISDSEICQVKGLWSDSRGFTASIVRLACIAAMYRMMTQNGYCVDS